MLMHATTPTIVTFVIYIIAMLLIGWLGYLATHNLSDYILGGRRLNSFITGLSAGASDMSGWLLMGLPGAVYVMGISGSWIAIGLIIGAWLNWRFVAAKLRSFTEKSGALTLPDFLAHRFEDNTHLLRIAAAVAILIFFTIYCSAGMVAGARLFESVFGIPYQVAIWAGALTTIAYVFLGGFLAISWTDTIQASLVFSALVITPFIIIHAAGGEAASIHAIQPGHLNLFNNMSAIGVISLLAWGLGYFGQPHILVRFMAAKSVKAIAKARYVNIIWMTLCLAGAISVGFFGAIYFSMHTGQAGVVNGNPETVFIEIAKVLFNPWATGILLASILAAIMSNLSCQLLVCSSALTKDIYKTFLRKDASQKELVWIGRLMVLGIALIAIWIASNPNSHILSMVSYAWAGFGAAFGPVILISLHWQGMTRNSAIAGIVTGTITILIWKHFAWFNLYEIVPGFILASVAIVVVGLLEQSSVKIKKYVKIPETV